MVLQIVVAALQAAIGALGLRVAARSRGAAGPHTAAWRITGAAFLLMGGSALVQNAFGSAAILAGPDTPTWNSFLAWSPAFNHSRIGAEVVFLALLAGLAVPRGRRGPAPHATWALLAAGLLGGALFGWVEGPLRPEGHYATVAVLDLAVFAVWALVLSALVLGDAADRWLVVALAVTAAPLPLNALWFVWLARADPAGWSPRPSHMQMYRVAFNLLVLMAVAHRLRLARRGVPVFGLGGGRG